MKSRTQRDLSSIISDDTFPSRRRVMETIETFHLVALGTQLRADCQGDDRNDTAIREHSLSALVK